MRSFTYAQLPHRVVFGAGARSRLVAQAERMGLARVLVLSTPGHRALAEDVSAPLGARVVGLFDGVRPHVPQETVELARRAVQELRADSTLAVGGGSTIGLGKALGLEPGLPQISVPTTYSGSEMTPNWGIVRDGVKQTGRDARVQPRAVIYDPELTVTLPPRVTATSGMNALAHCVEALYSVEQNPITSLVAEEGIRALASALPRATRKPDDLEARSEALYGAFLGGTALGAVPMALHHKLCHTVGGTFDLPHAEVHTVLLPHASRYNAEAAQEAMARVARALGVEDAPAGLFDLACNLDVPTSLEAIGMRREDLDRAADLAAQNPYPNPRPIERAAIRALLEDAFRGRRPERSTSPNRSPR
ncbi:MAG TPA: maleylacetate reductase [Myxococcaceae bacterium]|nr:maleylacetate reductase [Myxococcaceae bacterium]